MRIHPFTYYIMMFCLFVACDEVDKNERLIYVAPASVERAVLIEDFTGQRCVNCPTATTVIQQLQELYGEDNVIAVGIHSGPYAHRSTMTSPLLSLGTTIGDEYYNYFKVTAQPALMVNRHTSLIYNVNLLGEEVHNALSEQSPLQLTLEATRETQGQQVEVSISAMSNEDFTDAKVQVWVVEDSIVDAQYMPDGTINRTYIHNHVLRASVTQQTLGDDFPVDKENTTYCTYSFPIDAAWNPAHLSIVAFVYTERQGVIQVRKTPIMESSPQKKD